MTPSQISSGSEKKTGKSEKQKKPVKITEYKSFDFIRVDKLSDRNKVLKQYHNFCNHTSFTYKDFANEVVDYKNIDTEASHDYLSKHNSTYVLAMLSNVLTPFEENGPTIGSLLESYAAYKMLFSCNPNIEMDMSRMFASWRDTLNDLADNKSASLGVAMSSPVIRGLAGMLDKWADDKLDNSVNSHINSHELDSLVMTPRQVACLKVNFMEQCYKDMRAKPNSEAHVDYCMRMYNEAVQHLSVIAKNSGFDMAAVAADERYIVGIKMHKDPSYANMFEETHGLYGARPCIYGKALYLGEMITADEHSMYANNDGTGQFTVRRPMRNVDLIPQENIVCAFDLNERDHKKKYNEHALPTTLARYGEQLGFAIHHFDSEDCELSDSFKSKIKKSIGKHVNQFKDNFESVCVDDNIDPSIISNFTESFKKARECKDTDANFQAFMSEFKSVVCKKAVSDVRFPVHCYNPDFAKYVYNIFDDKSDHSRENNDTRLLSVDEELKTLLFSDKDKKDKEMTQQDVYDKLCTTYLSRLSASDVAACVLHACNNMEQGFDKYGEYHREFNERSSHKVVKSASASAKGSNDLCVAVNEESKQHSVNLEK